MASSTTAGPTLLPSPRSTKTEQSHGFHYGWLLVAIVLGATAVFATWVITQPDTDTISSSSTTVTGGLSPRAADHMDAQILQRSGTNSAPLSPNAADYRDARSNVQGANSSSPVSPNAVDRLDASQQEQSVPMSPSLADYRDRQP